MVSHSLLELNQSPGLRGLTEVTLYSLSGTKTAERKTMSVYS